MHGVVRVSRGSCPRVSDVASVASGARVVVEEEIYSTLDAARRVYVEESRRRRIYGSCTGLGGRLGEEGPCGRHGELAVLLEHAAGRGPAAPAWAARAFLFVRLTQLAAGSAPVRGVVAKRIEEALNSGVTPSIPLWGSVGASGDLAPSAHAFLCLYYGRGVTVEGQPCDEALSRRGLEPIELEVGEALALINNTAWSTALAAMGVARLEGALAAAIRVAGEAARAVAANPEHFSLEAVSIKRHRGPAGVAAALEPTTSGVEPRSLQAPYSLRCTPQVYGAVADALAWARQVVEAEACSATENPLVAGGRVYHACNFHAQHVAIASDAAATAAAVAASFAERRIERLMDSRVTGASDFAAWEGSSVGLMILQYTAAALAAEARALASPRSVNSIETSLGQEDHVSMAPAAALRLHKLACILEELIAIEKVVVDAIKALREGRRPLGEDTAAGDAVELAVERLGFNGLRGFCG